MKRNHLLLLSVAALMTAAGCSKDANELPQKEETYEFTLQASAAQFYGTRVSLEDDMVFSWTEGDQISVLFHKGSDNKFFTLTSDSDGASTIFGGTITSGYELGSDSGEKIALYPASASHSYASGNVSYYVPGEVDFTQSHFTAFIPMSAFGDDNNNFVFRPMVSVVKFSFTNIKSSISKVRFTVQNQTTFKLSGSYDCTTSSGEEPFLYWGPVWHQPGTAEGRLSFISSVDSGTATFYIPFTAWSGDNFQPVITLTDASNDASLYEATAKAGLPDGATDILNRIIIMPDIKAHAPEAWSFPSQYGINWNEEGASAEALNGVILCLKATADKDNVYVYFEIDNCIEIPEDIPFMYNSYIYFGEDDPFESWLTYNGSPRYLNWSSNNIGSSVVEHGDSICYEVALKRSGFPSLAGSSADIHMIVTDTSVSYDGEGKEVWAGGEWIGTAESITVSLP